MKLTMSVSAGAHNSKHNTDKEYRAKLDNVDPALSCNNLVIKDISIEEIYQLLFGDALKDYNDKQITKGHPERVITNYYEQIDESYKNDKRKVARGEKSKTNVPQPCYEYVFQLGNRDTWNSVQIDDLKNIYCEVFKRICEKTTGAINWFQSAIHVDEKDGTPHMHVAGVAYGTGNKRGLATQVSMSQALKTLKLKRLPDLQNLFMNELENVAFEYGIQRDVIGSDRRHQDVEEFRQTQRDLADATSKLDFKKEQLELTEEQLEVENQKLEGLRRTRIEREREVEQLEAEVEEFEEIISLAERLSQDSGEYKRAQEEIQQLRAVDERIGQIRIRIADIAKIISNAIAKLIERIWDDIRNPLNEIGDIRQISSDAERNYKSNELYNRNNIR